MEVTETATLVGISTRTAIRQYQKIRNICLSILKVNSTQIGGEGIEVEIDEIHIFKAKNNKGRLLAGQATWIVGGVEQTSKKAFMVMTKKRDKETLNNIILNWVLPHTTIYTDMWQGYNDLKALGYQHHTVNHSTNFLNPVDQSINTQKVERFWRSVKDSIPKGANGEKKSDHYFIYLFRRCFLNNSNDGQKFKMFLTYIKHQFPGLINQHQNQIIVESY